LSGRSGPASLPGPAHRPPPDRSCACFPPASSPAFSSTTAETPCVALGLPRSPRPSRWRRSGSVRRATGRRWRSCCSGSVRGARRAGGCTRGWRFGRKASWCGCSRRSPSGWGNWSTSPRFAPGSCRSIPRPISSRCSMRRTAVRSTRRGRASASYSSVASPWLNWRPRRVPWWIRTFIRRVWNWVPSLPSGRWRTTCGTPDSPRPFSCSSWAAPVPRLMSSQAGESRTRARSVLASTRWSHWSSGT
jgi:hypothetical protein